MTIRELIKELGKYDQDMPVAIKAHSKNHIDDYIELKSDKISKINGEKMECPITENTTYDAGIHGNRDTNFVSLEGKPKTRFDI